MNYDIKLEPHYVKIIEEMNLNSLVTALINWGNERGLEGIKTQGIYVLEDGTIEILCKEESCEK